MTVTTITKEQFYQRRIEDLEQQISQLKLKAEIAESTRSIARKLICEFIRLHGVDRLSAVIAAPEESDGDEEKNLRGVK